MPFVTMPVNAHKRLRPDEAAAAVLPKRQRLWGEFKARSLPMPTGVRRGPWVLQSRYNLPASLVAGSKHGRVETSAELQQMHWREVKRTTKARPLSIEHEEQKPTISPLFARRRGLGGLRLAPLTDYCLSACNSSQSSPSPESENDTPPSEVLPMTPPDSGIGSSVPSSEASDSTPVKDMSRRESTLRIKKVRKVKMHLEEYPPNSRRRRASRPGRKGSISEDTTEDDIRTPTPRTARPLLRRLNASRKLGLEALEEDSDIEIRSRRRSSMRHSLDLVSDGEDDEKPVRPVPRRRHTWPENPPLSVSSRRTRRGSSLRLNAVDASSHKKKIGNTEEKKVDDDGDAKPVKRRKNGPDQLVSEYEEKDDKEDTEERGRSPSAEMETEDFGFSIFEDGLEPEKAEIKPISLDGMEVDENKNDAPGREQDSGDEDDAPKRPRRIAPQAVEEGPSVEESSSPLRSPSPVSIQLSTPPRSRTPSLEPEEPELPGLLSPLSPPSPEYSLPTSKAPIHARISSILTPSSHRRSRKPMKFDPRNLSKHAYREPPHFYFSDDDAFDPDAVPRRLPSPPPLRTKDAILRGLDVDSCLERLENIYLASC